MVLSFSNSLTLVKVTCGRFEFAELAGRSLRPSVLGGCASLFLCTAVEPLGLIVIGVGRWVRSLKLAVVTFRSRRSTRDCVKWEAGG